MRPEGGLLEHTGFDISNVEWASAGYVVVQRGNGLKVEVTGSDVIDRAVTKCWDSTLGDDQEG